MYARIILLLFGGAILFMAVRRLRSYQLKERYTILFMFAGMPFFILAVWKDGVAWVGQQLGIHYYTVPVLCLTAFLIVMVFELLTIVSSQDRKIASLAQIVGILMEKHGMGDRDTVQPPSPPLNPEVHDA